MSQNQAAFTSAIYGSTGTSRLAGYYVEIPGDLKKMNLTDLKVISGGGHYWTECRIMMLPKFGEVPDGQLDFLIDKKFKNIQVVMPQQTTPPFNQTRHTFATGEFGRAVELLSNRAFGAVLILKDGTDPALMAELDSYPGERMFTVALDDDEAPAP